jgi:hypothetical protein
MAWGRRAHSTTREFGETFTDTNRNGSEVPIPSQQCKCWHKSLSYGREEPVLETASPRQCNASPQSQVSQPWRQGLESYKASICSRTGDKGTMMELVAPVQAKMEIDAPAKREALPRCHEIGSCHDTEREQRRQSHEWKELRTQGLPQQDVGDLMRSLSPAGEGNPDTREDRIDKSY